MNNTLIRQEERNRYIESLDRIQEYCVKISSYNLKNMSNNKIIQYYTKEIFKEVRSMEAELLKNSAKETTSVSVKKNGFLERIRRMLNG